MSCKGRSFKIFSELSDSGFHMSFPHELILFVISEYVDL